MRKKGNPSDEPKQRTAAYRLMCVERVLGGLSAVKVGREFGDSPHAISNWVKRFKMEGVAGLEDRPRSGRPSKLTPAQQRSLRQFVARAEARSERLSGDEIAKFVQEKFGIELTRQHGLRLLKRFRTA